MNKDLNIVADVNNPIEFRKADVNDAASLTRIRSMLLMELNSNATDETRKEIETANRSYLDSSLKDGSYVAWLGVNNGRIIASSGLSFSLVPPSFKCPDGRSAYITSMYTFPGYRNQVIASELIKRIVGEATERGYGRITLISTAAGRAIYEKFGFVGVEGTMEFLNNNIERKKL